MAKVVFHTTAGVKKVCCFAEKFEMCRLSCSALHLQQFAMAVSSCYITPFCEANLLIKTDQNAKCNEKELHQLTVFNGRQQRQDVQFAFAIT